jgi:hypothetical protein
MRESIRQRYISFPGQVTDKNYYSAAPLKDHSTHQTTETKKAPHRALIFQPKGIIATSKQG